MKNYGHVTRPKTSVPAGVNTTIITQPTRQLGGGGVRLMRLPDGSLTADLQGFYDYDRQQASACHNHE